MSTLPQGSDLPAFTRFLLQEDPKLLSPLTQQALQDSRALLDDIGFSIRYFSEQKQKLTR